MRCQTKTYSSKNFVLKSNYILILIGTRAKWHATVFQYFFIDLNVHVSGIFKKGRYQNIRHPQCLPALKTLSLVNATSEIVRLSAFSE